MSRPADATAAAATRPYFSICIPQFNRTDFLLAALRSFVEQDFQDFEVCISDGASTDGGFDRIRAFLEASGLRHVLARSDRNLRYDENLRRSIGLATGRYAILMGNDDRFAHPGVLGLLHERIEAAAPVKVALINYIELSSGAVYKRVGENAAVDGDIPLAAALFRNYSFVSGIVFDADSAQSLATDRVDGSEMYQVFIATRLVAEGGRFLGIADVLIEKDIQIEGQTVDSYRARPRDPWWRIARRPLPLTRLFETVHRGLEGVGDPSERSAALSRVARQLYTFTFPFWIFEYRRVQGWGYALGVYRALSPDRVISNGALGPAARLSNWVLYVAVGAAGFLAPVGLFDAMRPALYRLAKRAGTGRS